MLQSNFIEITFRHGCTINLLLIFRTSFPKNTHVWTTASEVFCELKREQNEMFLLILKAFWVFFIFIRIYLEFHWSEKQKHWIVIKDGANYSKGLTFLFVSMFFWILLTTFILLLIFLADCRHVVIKIQLAVYFNLLVRIRMTEV